MDSFIGEIRIFCGNYAPEGWAFCNGDLLSIQQYTALFSVLGTRFGGDGRTNFGLPNLMGRAPMHQGQGPGLTNRVFAQAGGAGTVTLTQNQMPSHNHAARCLSSVPASGQGVLDPTNGVWAAYPVLRSDPKPTGYQATANTVMSSQALTVAGGNQPHNNMQPYLKMSFIICLTDGVYPVRPQ